MELQREITAEICSWFCGNLTFSIFSWYKGSCWGLDKVSSLLSFQPWVLLLSIDVTLQMSSSRDFSCACPRVLTWQIPYTFPSFEKFEKEARGTQSYSTSFSSVPWKYCRKVSSFSEKAKANRPLRAIWRSMCARSKNNFRHTALQFKAYLTS